MSGFIAIYHTDDQPVQPRLLSSLVESLKLRGPDRQKIWIDGSIGMGHALFQTTNEAKYEKQPATLDQLVWITCSARIDDRKNLVNKLGMTKELDLNKTPDSKLILHAYKKWGEDCLDHLLGDFAFVIWDSRNKKIFCARDQFGMRQLYYAKKNQMLIVGNSLQCMIKHPQITTELNDKAIGGFLLFGDYMWMDKSLTMFNEVMTLLPAHKLVFQSGRIVIKQYWDIPKNVPLLHYTNENDYVEHFQEVFNEAVIDRLRAPSIAISMSGGMDSTAIAATIRQLQKEKRIPETELNAITIVYDDLLSCNERYYSGLVAKYHSIPIHYIVGDNYSFLRSDTGTTRPIEISQPLLWIENERKISEFSRVVLSGQAGDNLLDYPSNFSFGKDINHLFSSIQNIIKLYYFYGKRPPLGIGLRKRINSLFEKKETSIETSFPYPLWIKSEFEKKMDLKKKWEKMWTSDPEKSATRYSKLRQSLMEPNWNTDDMLMNSDFTISERRDPYLDLRMVNYVLSLPSLPWLFNKHILRQTMTNKLPKEICYRPKTTLGELNHALFTNSDTIWIEKRKLNDKLLHYLNKPTTTEEILKNSALSYIDSRPFILDIWLSNLEKREI